MHRATLTGPGQFERRLVQASGASGTKIARRALGHQKGEFTCPLYSGFLAFPSASYFFLCCLEWSISEPRDASRAKLTLLSHALSSALTELFAAVRASLKKFSEKIESCCGASDDLNAAVRTVEH